MDWNPKNEEREPSEGALETSGEDASDIDPAEFFDPEEFGYRRSKARLLTTGGHG